MTVDTACSSTLVALDVSILRLRTGLEAVICSGSQLNLIAEPCPARSAWKQKSSRGLLTRRVCPSQEPFVAFSNGRLLSASGRCRTFDTSADGISDALL